MNSNDNPDGDEFADSWENWPNGLLPGHAVPLSALKALRSHTGMPDRLLAMPHYTTQLLSDLEEEYRSIGSGKTSLINLLAAKYGVRKLDAEVVSAQLTQEPFRGLRHQSLAEAAVKGVPPSDKTTPVSHYTPDQSDRCVHCFRRDIFECTCGHYLSLRDAAQPGISLIELMSRPVVSFDSFEMKRRT